MSSDVMRNTALLDLVDELRELSDTHREMSEPHEVFPGQNGITVTSFDADFEDGLYTEQFAQVEILSNGWVKVVLEENGSEIIEYYPPDKIDHISTAVKLSEGGRSK